MINKVAIIAGGTGGIGSAIAKRLAEGAYQVVVLYKNTLAREANSFISALPGSGHKILSCDVTDFAAVERAIRSVAEEKGRIDACIYSVIDKLVRKKITELDSASFQFQFESAVFGGFNLFKSVAPIMQRQSQGRIIGVTSAALEPNADTGRMGAYVPAKYALRGLLREFARELAPYGITVNAVAPGFVPTALNEDLPGEMPELMRKKNPMKKVVSSEDVANIVAFFCSDEAASLTGLSIPVTYGEVMNL